MTNNKLLKSSVGIIILSVVIIMIANIMLKVDKPVFLENYCDGFHKIIIEVKIIGKDLFR